MNVIDRLCKPDMTIPQGVLAAIYVLSIAEETSNYVRGPMSVSVIRRHGIWEEKPSYIQEMNERIKVYEAQLNNVFLSCADTSVSVKDLNHIIQEFSGTASTLHRLQIDRQVSSLTLENMALTGDAYPKIPLGTAVIVDFDEQNTFKSAVMAHDHSQEELDEFAKKAKFGFLGKGFTEYVVKRVGDRYSLAVSRRWEGTENEDLGLKTREELASFLEGKNVAPPLDAKTLLMFMDGGDGNQSVFYAKPLF